MTKRKLYFGLAAECALNSTNCQQRHGAIVVRNHRIISYNNNTRSYHAEHHALKQCKL